mmetsp:Transcript_79963/g.129603  ORF Transcript_79963/g.129603 Transcript_79963/m.129603 type:complete len:462 (+) Transcript_79963:37-1422(+)|eukprot:CAMPEP_0179449564 /NCGR_PEP_ID=MMETSP0799-20121207/33484_1 /TAXON_ID=46947 /ORGANISM="Geminigera cryophila, Strain CCMP2564" /LENGTH=461 /DNA_ID=CAMNT_0021242681 /DNA_START=36 /DNA_END=1421 /DNA_ORIENTATION=+
MKHGRDKQDCGAEGGTSKRQRDSEVVLVGGEAKLRLAALWREEKWCDVKVRVGSEVFPAHRVVLAAESSFLAILFDGQFKDSLSPIVDVREIDPCVFALALDFMYDGTCAVKDVSTLQEVLSLASVLQIDALFAAAATALDQHLTIDNCASMLACTDQHHLPHLKNRAEVVAQEAFVTVASDPAVPISSLQALLQNDNLNVESEQEVFETLAMWLKGQAEPLCEEEQITLFALVRFPLLSQDFIDSTVLTEPVFATLGAHKLLLAQFKEFVFGKKPKQRGRANSHILSNEQHRQILSWLDKGNAAKLELLYRASSDGWKGLHFHSKCDNKGATITVIKCSGGYVFGGFSSAPWESHGGYKPSAGAFLFSLHRPGGVGPVKLALKTDHEQHAVHFSASHGPLFGGGLDISVLDSANSNAESYTWLSTYALPSGHECDGCEFFTGAKNYRAAEIEVFRLSLSP